MDGRAVSETFLVLVLQSLQSPGKRGRSKSLTHGRHTGNEDREDGNPLASYLHLEDLMYRTINWLKEKPTRLDVGAYKEMPVREKKFVAESKKMPSRQQKLETRTG